LRGLSTAVSYLADTALTAFHSAKLTYGFFTAERCRSHKSFSNYHNNSLLTLPTAVTPLTAAEQAAVPMITTTACQLTCGCQTAVSCGSDSFSMCQQQQLANRTYCCNTADSCRSHSFSGVDNNSLDSSNPWAIAIYKGRFKVANNIDI
jgi:hypothetical protein